MATKKAKSTSAKPGKADIKVLRSELASAESKRDKGKQRAVRAEAVTADLRARLTVAEKDLKNEKKAAVTAAAVSPREVFSALDRRGCAKRGEDVLNGWCA